jgi:hypothetical protein
MELGKPCAGKPHARFDEGREADGHWPVRPFNPPLPAYSTRLLHAMQKSVLFLAVMCLLTSYQSRTLAQNADINPSSAVVWVIGYVVHPKPIPWQHGLTLEAALAAAGGIKPATYSPTEGDTYAGDIRIWRGLPGKKPQKNEIVRIRIKDFESQAQTRGRQIEEGETIEVGVILW